MNKGKIFLLPLDERPCNYNYPSIMSQTDYEVILPPKEIMGDKKTPGDTDKIADWLIEKVNDADAMVISLDTLVYGGIVPSRLHHNSEDELIERVNILDKLKKINPAVKLYVFGLIMRCPVYSSNDEEPDYYKDFGTDIHLYGKYTHLEKLNKLTDEDKKDFERVKNTVGKIELSDYVERRETNISVLMHALSYVADNTVDYFVVPQDDSAPYGFTAMDQIKVREYLKSNVLHMRTAMYPSADDIGMTLLARAASELTGIVPKVYVHYPSVKGALTIPQYEDRIIGETVKYHILSVGGIQVYSLIEADILLAVNIGSGMETDALLEIIGSSCKKKTQASESVRFYDVERNLAEFVNYIKYALSMNKYVAIADVARVNKGDEELISILNREDLLLKIHGYAGWNTSSNTIGTSLSSSVLYMAGHDDRGLKSFLLHRYYEDIGYMCYARMHITKNFLDDMGLSYHHTDGKKGKTARLIQKELAEYMSKNYPVLSACVDKLEVTLPWERMFEIDLKLTVL